PGWSHAELRVVGWLVAKRPRPFALVSRAPGPPWLLAAGQGGCLAAETANAPVPVFVFWTFSDPPLELPLSELGASAVFALPRLNTPPTRCRRGPRTPSSRPPRRTRPPAHRPGNRRAWTP